MWFPETARGFDAPLTLPLDDEASSQSINAVWPSSTHASENVAESETDVPTATGVTGSVRLAIAGAAFVTVTSFG